MAGDVEYDAAVLQEFADRLYTKAQWLVAKAVVFGASAGAAAGYAISLASGARDGGACALAGALVGTAAGFIFGSERSLTLKIQAQTALCQMQIEANTRRAPDVDRVMRIRALKNGESGEVRDRA